MVRVIYRRASHAAASLPLCFARIIHNTQYTFLAVGERGGSVVECRTPEREVGGSKPTAAVLCP